MNQCVCHYSNPEFCPVHKDDPARLMTAVACPHVAQCTYCNGVNLVDEGHYYITGEINAINVHTWRRDLMMMALNRQQHVRPSLSDSITTWLETQGGGVTEGIALFETIRYIESVYDIPVTVAVMGSAASMGSV